MATTREERIRKQVMEECAKQGALLQSRQIEAVVRVMARREADIEETTDRLGERCERLEERLDALEQAVVKLGLGQP